MSNQLILFTFLYDVAKAKAANQQSRQDLRHSGQGEVS
jgi:hypothetical protein